MPGQRSPDLDENDGDFSRHPGNRRVRMRAKYLIGADYEAEAVVARPPDQVRPADVLGFITAQRTGRGGEHGALQPVQAAGEPGGVSAATVRRRRGEGTPRRGTHSSVGAAA